MIISRRLIALLVSLGFIVPSLAFALEGTGPRVTITGTVQAVTISEKNKYDEFGGQYTVEANNGQIVNVVLDKYAKVISEGRLSRKSLLPENVTSGMQVRIRGWRVNSDTLTASLIVILNAELNPVLAMAGTIQSVDGSSVTILAADGLPHTFSVTNETEVNLSYTVYGANGLTLIGKKALLTLNQLNRTQVRVIRITGEQDAEIGRAHV